MLDLSLESGWRGTSTWAQALSRRNRRPSMNARCAPFYLCVTTVLLSACFALCCLLFPVLFRLGGAIQNVSLTSSSSESSSVDEEIPGAIPELDHLRLIRGWQRLLYFTASMFMFCALVNAAAFFVLLYVALGPEGDGLDFDQYPPPAPPVATVVINELIVLVGSFIISSVALKKWAFYSKLQGGPRCAIPQLLFAAELCRRLSAMIFLIFPRQLPVVKHCAQGFYHDPTLNFSYVPSYHTPEVLHLVDEFIPFIIGGRLASESCSALLVWQLLRNLTKTNTVPRPFHVSNIFCIILMMSAIFSFAVGYCTTLVSREAKIELQFVYFGSRIGVGMGTLYTGASVRRWITVQGGLKLGRQRVLLRRLISGGVLLTLHAAKNFYESWFPKQGVTYVLGGLAPLILSGLHVMAFMRPPQGDSTPVTSRKATGRSFISFVTNPQLNRGVSANLSRQVRLDMQSSVSQVGISAPIAREKIEYSEHNRTTPIERLSFTTLEVVNLFIKPRTSEAQCAYSNLVFGSCDNGGVPHVGVAHVFVSHSWQYKFSTLLDILEEHEEEVGPLYYWIDIFAINQHKPGDKGELDQLGPTIKDCGHVLLAASPWSAPLVFNRVWCLFEMHTAWREGVQVDMQISSQEKREFFRNLETNYWLVCKAVDNIDARNAKATLEEDRTHILHMIEVDCGFQAFNTNISEILRATFLNLVLSCTLATSN